MASRTNKKTLVYNLLFLVVCGGIFLFLWSAPEETTPRLPNDDNHLEFLHMDKKEAEKVCETCHTKSNNMALSPDHPPKNRCLLCHKRDG